VDDLLLHADLHLEIKAKVVYAAKLRELPALGPLCAQTVVGVLSDLLRVASLWQSFVVWHVGFRPY
jgi:hypothetical protein